MQLQFVLNLVLYGSIDNNSRMHPKLVDNFTTNTWWYLHGLALVATQFQIIILLMPQHSLIMRWLGYLCWIVLCIWFPCYLSYCFLFIYLKPRMSHPQLTHQNNVTIRFVQNPRTILYMVDFHSFLCSAVVSILPYRL